MPSLHNTVEWLNQELLKKEDCSVLTLIWGKLLDEQVFSKTDLQPPSLLQTIF